MHDSVTNNGARSLQRKSLEQYGPFGEALLTFIIFAKPTVGESEYKIFFLENTYTLLTIQSRLIKIVGNE